jgi:hypothetical protein
MRLVMSLLGFGLCVASASAIVAGEVIVRATAEPTDPWVGQRVILRIEVLAADAWAQIGTFEPIELPGAYLLQTDSQGSRLQETIDGTGYTGQAYALSLFPQRAGPLRVPPLPVAVSVKTWGVEATERSQQAETPEVSLDVRLPPGAEGVADLVSTGRFRASQTWSPENASPKVGDAVERSVTREASNLSAMALAPIETRRIDGVGIYPKEPDLDDATDRGSLDARRVDRVTYVFEQAGSVQLPALEFVWWNSDAERLETVTLAGMDLEIAPGAMSASAGPPAAPGSAVTARWRWLLLAAGVVAALLAWRLGPSLRARLQQWGAQRAASERRYFRRMIASIDSGDARRALRDIMRWLDRVQPDDDPALLGEFSGRWGEQRDAAAVDDLVRAASTGGALADPKALHTAFSGMRRRLRRCKGARRRSQVPLPELDVG